MHLAGCNAQHNENQFGYRIGIGTRRIENANAFVRCLVEGDVVDTRAGARDALHCGEVVRIDERAANEQSVRRACIRRHGIRVGEKLEALGRNIVQSLNAIHAVTLFFEGGEGVKFNRRGPKLQT